MAICASHDVADSACKGGGVYKAAERPQANSRSTGANTRSGSAARAARDSGADVEPAGCRAFPGSGGNADASANANANANANAESTSDHRAGDCWYCGG
jgi:hypothetical protein